MFKMALKLFKNVHIHLENQSVLHITVNLHLKIGFHLLCLWMVKPNATKSRQDFPSSLVCRTQMHTYY